MEALVTMNDNNWQNAQLGNAVIVFSLISKRFPQISDEQQPSLLFLLIRLQLIYYTDEPCVQRRGASFSDTTTVFQKPVIFER